MRRIARRNLMARPVIRQGGSLLALIVALLALGLSARDGLAAGSFNVNGQAAALKISVDGACNPGTITSDSPPIPASGGIGTGLVIKTTSTVFGCLATECSPENLIMGDELFIYSSVSAATEMAIPDETWTGDLVVQNIPPASVDHNNDGDTADPGESCPEQNHFPNEFPANGYIFVGTEQLHFSARDGDSFTIDGRGGSASMHPAGSFVRAQNLLKLRARAVPRYVGGPPTSEASHGVGTTVGSPLVYMNCRALLLEPMGTAQVGSRSRCYFVLEPGYNTSTCPGTPSSCYWPDGAMLGGALQQLRPVVYHELSEGTSSPSGGMALLSLKTQFAGVSCFEQIPGQLWVQVLTDTNIDKDFTPNDQDDGAFQIRAFTDSSCSGPAAVILGGQKGVDDNLTSVQLPASQDTDGDGCRDSRELNNSQATGGFRDPFNHYDYFNPTGDKLNRVDDILMVVNRYFQDDNDATPGEPPYVAGYNPETDRTVLGPSTWNLGKPNGQQRVDDILNSVKQYFHDCV